MPPNLPFMSGITGIFRGNRPPQPPRPAPITAAAKPLPADRSDYPAYPTQNLKRLVELLRGSPRPHLLDIGRLTDRNIEWFIHKDFRVTIDEQFHKLPAAPPAVESASPRRPEPAPPALLPPLEFPDGQFDAVIAWDLYDFLAPLQAQALTAEIGRVLKPRGLLLAFFHSDRSVAERAIRYHILQDDRLEYHPTRGVARRRVYENMDIQQIFSEFEVVNTCFLANQVREVLVRRR